MNILLNFLIALAPSICFGEWQQSFAAFAFMEFTVFIVLDIADDIKEAAHNSRRD